ncbi:hypothetical protein FQ154_17475 [Paeniglutamicibacter gangotriensis]|uniref:CobQ/CobB/MinD/ParA nucleotide binding domain-containing protein n=1 Tax=Paeniglutamicibacter gangotriensis TaxID=254787 RepID=A0A5B0E3T6_9MICC|nr:septum site-determining protein Ssd [Paeniglutamicibacter gangotriensis]KAA0973614.1 hypothetical protein FQ154_17475 [Paeniglutamicibacter gangotriensis]
MEDQSRFVARPTSADRRNLHLPALRVARARMEPVVVGSGGGAAPRTEVKTSTGMPPQSPEPQLPPVPQLPTQPRAVAAADPGAGAQSQARPAELARAILFSRDMELAQVLAEVAVGAGVQLLLCRDAAEAAEHREEVILVGVDAVAEVDARLATAALVFTGREENQDVLWRAAATCPGARVAVLPQAAPWLGEYLGELGLHAGRAHTAIVAGGAGGTGTTTFAALLAATLTLDGHRTLLLDADPHSSGIWPLLRAREPDGLGWEDLRNSRGQLSPGQLAEILPLAAGTAVLSWVRDPGCFVPSEALVTEVLAASRRIYEHIVIDAGHLAGIPGPMTALANTRLLVLPASGPAAAGAGRRLGEQAAHWRLILSGRLASGTDTRELARRAGIEPGGYFAPSRRIGRAAADGALMNVLARRRLRAAITVLGSGAQRAAGQAA